MTALVEDTAAARLMAIEMGAMDFTSVISFSIGGQHRPACK
jgi:hypothetical protein